MFFLSYWILPLLSALVWLATLLSLLIKWVLDGQPHYPSMDPDQHIAYISDVGAQYLKPLFVAGSCITVVLFDLAFLSERWLRHTGRLASNTHLSEKILSWLGILFAIAGAAGLILLSIFDTLRHPRLHDGFLLLFLGGYILSAIFICAEYQRLGVHQSTTKILATSFWVKLVFIIVEVILAIAFVTENFTGHPNVAAVLEWVIALIFTFWVLSFYIDLLPAVRNKNGRGGDGIPQIEMGGPSGTHVVHDDHFRGPETDYVHSRGSTLVGGEGTANGNGGVAQYTNGGFRAGKKSGAPNGSMLGNSGTTWQDRRDGAHPSSRNF